MTGILLSLVAFYRRFVSPLTPGVCRYEPSCSHYAELCIYHHGALHGGWLALCRLARCNPFFRGGIDVPALARVRCVRARLRPHLSVVRF